MTELRPIRRALLSVSDKTGLDAEANGEGFVDGPGATAQELEDAGRLVVVAPTYLMRYPAAGLPGRCRLDVGRGPARGLAAVRVRAGIRVAPGGRWLRRGQARQDAGVAGITSRDATPAGVLILLGWKP
jgi:hypothetical protein